MQTEKHTTALKARKVKGILEKSTQGPLKLESSLLTIWPPRIQPLDIRYH